MIKNAKENKNITESVRDKKIKEERASIEIAIDNSVKSGEYCCTVPLMFSVNKEHLEDLGYLVTAYGTGRIEISWY